MIPQNSHAPERQKRTIELENVGLHEVPAHGACEIMNVVRPESGSTQTPGGGIEVWQVQRPSQDDPCAHVINGPCPIPVGERHRVGTMHSPMIAKVDQSYPAGTPIGIQADSFELTEHRCGYVAHGAHDAVSGTMEVARYDNCPNEMMVRATECILPGEGGDAQPQKFEGGAFVDDTDRYPIEICDPLCWLLALPGEKLEVKRDHCTDDCWRPSHPFGLKRRVKVEYEIDCNASGTVTIMEHSTGSWSESTCTITAHNLSNRKIACDAAEEATLIITEGDCTGWLIPDQRPLHATATLSSDMCATSAALTGFAAVDVCEWTPYPEVTEADNPLQLYGCAGQTVLLGWNDAECKWFVVQVQPIVLPTGDEPIVEFRCDPSEGFQYRQLKGQIAVQWCGDCQESEWFTPTDMMQDVDVLTGVVSWCGQSPDVEEYQGVRVTDVDCEPITPTITLDITPPLGAHQLLLTGVSCAPFGEQFGGSRYVWIEGLDAPGETLVALPELDECESDCITLYFQWYDDQSPEQPVGEPFQIGSDKDGICCDDELDPEDPQFTQECSLELKTVRHQVLGCGGSESGTPISLPMKFIRIADPEQSPTYDPVMEGEDVVGCVRSQATKALCVLACDLGEGEPITENLTRIDPMTRAELGIEGEGEEAEICLYPHKTPIFVLAGCEQDEEAMEKSCVPCDCENGEQETPVTTLPECHAFPDIILNGEIGEGNFGEAESWDCGFQWREQGEEEWNEIGFTTLLDEGPFDETIDGVAAGLASDTTYEFRAVARDDWNDPAVTRFGEILSFIYDPSDPDGD